MKIFQGALFRNICVLGLGILLVAYPDMTAELLVMLVGCVFLIPGVVALISYFASSRSGAASAAPRLVFPLLGVGSILWGLILILMPQFFIRFLMYVLGIMLVLIGGNQVAYLFSLRRFARVPLGFYVLPVVVLLMGVLVLFNPIEIAGSPFLLVGVCCIVSALSKLWNLYKFRRAGRSEVTTIETLSSYEEAEEVKSELTEDDFSKN